MLIAMLSNTHTEVSGILALEHRQRSVPQRGASVVGNGSSERVSGFAADSPETGGRTLVEGATFAVCGAGGDIDGVGPQGLFVEDARVLSRWRLRVDGQRLEPLAGFTEEPFFGVYVARAPLRAGQVEPTVVLERRRYVGAGMREDLIVHNHGSEAAGISLTMELACDLADLFEVKLGRLGEERLVSIETSEEEWRAKGRCGRVVRNVVVRAPGAAIGPETITYRVVVPAHGTWLASLEVRVGVDGVEVPPRFPIGAAPERSAPAKQMAQWRSSSPIVEADSPALVATIGRSETDLAALRITDPAVPGVAAVAAGAPWFMALFGRDALWTSSMTLALSPELALGSLRALAYHQGKVVDPMSEEEPGRIVHELRFGVDPTLALGGTNRYYGSVDATPLFVVVLGQLARWGADPEVVDDLLPAADRALEWIARYGDKDGDGLVEYARGTDRGLRNQGWKDSLDGVNFADGTLAEPPIALVEVQAYVYAAYRARAELARARGDRETEQHFEAEADAMRRRIEERFWLPAGYFAVGLDQDKRPIDALASNIGHVLWAGAASPERAALVAERLLSPELFSGYGIRTLATSMGAYNPASYHNGSVWPHDTAIAVAGLVRYGFRRHAQKVAAGLIQAATYFSGRLPELFCGYDKGDYPGPVPYPTSCSPQAWASAAPVSLLTSMLGLDPNVPAGEVRVDPAVPPEWGALRLADLSLGGERLTVAVDKSGEVTVSGVERLRLVGARA
jgi:glycogen debranching enzyme